MMLMMPPAVLVLVLVQQILMRSLLRPLPLLLLSLFPLQPLLQKDDVPECQHCRYGRNQVQKRQRCQGKAQRCGSVVAVGLGQQAMPMLLHPSGHPALAGPCMGMC